MGTDLPAVVCPVCGEPLDAREVSHVGLMRCPMCLQDVEPQFEEGE